MRLAIKLWVLMPLLFLCAPSVFAHVTLECDGKKARWKESTVTYRVKRVSFPSGSPFTSSLTTAVASWNLNPSNFNFFLTSDSSSRMASGDGHNDIAATNDQAVIAGARGITLNLFECNEIVESDILFNTEVSWSPGSLKSPLGVYGGDHDTFEGVAEHELGHGLGLQHEDRVLNIMLTPVQFHTNWAFAHTYPGEDASDGAVFLYGVDPSRPQDLGVCHFRFHEVVGQIKRTAIFDHEPIEVNNWTEMMELVDGFAAWRDFESEPRFIVYNGQTIWPEFVYENNGSDTQTVRVGFYLSEDDNITTSDQRIGGWTLTLGRGWPYTTTLPVTLPSDLYEGQDYELGVIIDDDDRVSEPFGEMNATYTGIRVGMAQLASLTFNPIYVTGGAATTGTVTLNGAAPPGGVYIPLHHDHPMSVTMPPGVTIPAGSNSATFSVSTTAITRVGNGYVAINSTAWRPGGGGSAAGTFYLKALDGDHSGETFCEANPDNSLCLMCKDNPDLPFCDTVVGSSGEDEYIDIERLIIGIDQPYRFRERRDRRPYRP